MSEEYQYTPTYPPSNLDPELTDWIAREFQNIGLALHERIGLLGQDGAWADYLGSISSSKVGGSAPTWAVFRGNMDAYSFSPTVAQEVFINIHINHDIKRGTKIYPHIHWSQSAATPSGVVRWGIEYTVAKGHDQQAFPAPTTVYVEQTCSAQYQHMIAEVSDGDAIASDNIEPDSVIMVRLFRDAAHANDTSSDAAFGIFVDMHYQLERIATVGKKPDFYSGTGV